MPSIRATTPPPAPCRLAHHRPGARVCWTEGLSPQRGTVTAHRGEGRWITVRRGDGTTMSMPCGPVAAVRLAVAR